MLPFQASREGGLQLHGPRLILDATHGVHSQCGEMGWLEWPPLPQLSRVVVAALRGVA